MKNNMNMLKRRSVRKRRIQGEKAYCQKTDEMMEIKVKELIRFFFLAIK